RHMSFVVAEINLHVPQRRIVGFDFRDDRRERADVCPYRIPAHHFQFSLIIKSLTVDREVVDATVLEWKRAGAIKSGEEIVGAGSASLFRRNSFVTSRLAEILNRISGSDRVAR